MTNPAIEFPTRRLSPGEAKRGIFQLFAFLSNIENIVYQNAGSKGVNIDKLALPETEISQLLANSNLDPNNKRALESLLRIPSESDSLQVQDQVRGSIARLTTFFTNGDLSVLKPEDQLYQEFVSSITQGSSPNSKFVLTLLPTLLRKNAGLPYEPIL